MNSIKPPIELKQCSRCSQFIVRSTVQHGRYHLLLTRKLSELYGSGANTACCSSHLHYFDVFAARIAGILGKTKQQKSKLKKRNVIMCFFTFLKLCAFSEGNQITQILQRKHRCVGKCRIHTKARNWSN